MALSSSRRLTVSSCREIAYQQGALRNVTYWVVFVVSRSRQKSMSVGEEKVQRALILGAGHVSAPVVEYLTKRNVAVTLGELCSCYFNVLYEQFALNITSIFSIVVEDRSGRHRISLSGSHTDSCGYQG